MYILQPIIIISPICFHLNRWEYGKCNCSSEEHLRNPNHVEILIYTYYSCLPKIKNWIVSRDPGPLKREISAPRFWPEVTLWWVCGIWTAVKFKVALRWYGESIRSQFLKPWNENFKRSHQNKLKKAVPCLFTWTQKLLNKGNTFVAFKVI